MHRVWVLERADQFFHAWLENGESRHPGCGLWIRYHIYESSESLFVPFPYSD